MYKLLKVNLEIGISGFGICIVLTRNRKRNLVILMNSDWLNNY